MLIYKSLDEDNQKSFWRPNGPICKQFLSSFAYGMYDTASRDQERPWRGQKPRGAQQAGYLYPLQLVV
jgi:hypothetical protein